MAPELRVMTFNIRTSTARDLRFAWDLRKHLVIERIRHFDPDLLGLQECQDGEQRMFIEQQLPDYGFLGVRRGEDNRIGREMAPLMYRKSAFDLLDSGFFWLSRQPSVPGSKLFGAVFPRAVAWARLRPLDSVAAELFFFNTHFDYMPLILAASARVLREQIWLITGGAPAIVVGDFNTPAGGTAYGVLSEPFVETNGRFALVDTMEGHRRSGIRLPGTIHKFGRINRPIIIDWILASQQFVVLESNVDDYDDNGLYPSDHFPVTAVLSPKLSGQATS
ncbi:MAG: endonuclease/exonuclease/phosphatase family protein [Candidatus Promineifilaceae bacterium]